MKSTLHKLGFLATSTQTTKGTGRWESQRGHVEFKRQPRYRNDPLVVEAHEEDKNKGEELNRMMLLLGRRKRSGLKRGLKAGG